MYETTIILLHPVPNKKKYLVFSLLIWYIVKSYLRFPWKNFNTNSTLFVIPTIYHNSQKAYGEISVANNHEINNNHTSHDHTIEIPI